MHDSPISTTRAWSSNFSVRAFISLGVLAVVAIAQPSPSLAQPAQPQSAQSQSPQAQYTPYTGSVVPGISPYRQPDLEPYILGAGDGIQIDIFDVPEFSGQNGQYTVLIDGTLNLPWVGKVPVQGLNLEQAAQVLSQRYARFINDPLITVTLLTPRPLRVGVVGQVNRPGVYTVAANATDTQRFTVTQAIQNAGGITQLANVRGIEVRRPQSNGRDENISIDLWSFLQTGDLSEDLVLRDGDTLVIPEVTALTPEEATQLASTSFSPESINVNVVGEVVNPGQLAVLPNATLNQAILAAGGFDNRRARRRDVQLIRLNNDGTVDKRTIPVDFAEGISEDNNPSLRNNDIIVVGRSGIASTSDFLDTVLTPVTSVFSIFRLFGF
ncbi:MULTISPECIES: polysaccharide biosynthesis/export family protein [unclassified Leptolyngbya]|uniref:polysaccharide biosynthesis/export family protein n=1 Tax=unclassified Leptolyngbya TaxID=2650499 RepID=UPI001685A2D7|nr:MULTISPECIES: polysaccharide biosynthesis/export family protein [unclassified Leptolyngbya]MBD1912802.1 polysaccharide export protein [Leptolyngbya sp. FACHB-8]MBD2157749.1 polysaccharide export protein [Leptolyngbya sp. FACHB-16]